MTFLFSIFKILSQILRSSFVWEIRIIIRFSLNSEIISNISFFVFRSSEDVDSSKIINSLSAYNALAIDNLCICPPEKFAPNSEIFVSIPSDKF